MLWPRARRELPSPALQRDPPVPHARPTLRRSTSGSKDWSREGWGRWKFMWNWPASVPGQQMFALEPGCGSLQAVGGRRLQMVSRVGFLVGSGQGLSLWGPSGLQDSSHHCLFTRCRVRARPAELAAPPPRHCELAEPGAGSPWGGLRPGRRLPSPWEHPTHLKCNTWFRAPWEGIRSL